MTQETINLDVFTPPPGPTLPVTPRPTVATSPTAPTRQIFTLVISQFQVSHLAALTSADFVTPRHIEFPQNPTHTALPAPCVPHRPKASHARLIYRLKRKIKLNSLQ